VVCLDTGLDYFDSLLFCSIANCHLGRINVNIQHNNDPDFLSKLSRKHHFEPEDLLPENIILDPVKDQFVFLKPNEIHTDTYNLVAYKIVEGCFTFFIKRKEIKNYVATYKDEIDQEIELPEIVGEYHRYSGAFNTNKVTVCFGER